MVGTVCIPEYKSNLENFVVEESGSGLANILESGPGLLMSDLRSVPALKTCGLESCPGLRVCGLWSGSGLEMAGLGSVSGLEASVLESVSGLETTSLEPEFGLKHGTWALTNGLGRERLSGGTKGGMHPNIIAADDFRSDGGSGLGGWGQKRTDSYGW